MRLDEVLPLIQPDHAAARHRSVAIWAAVVSGLTAGAAIAWAIPSGSDPELGPLLHLMAAIKLGMVLGAAALAQWRLRRPAPARPAALAIGSVGLMAVSPAMVWAPSHLLAAGFLFHAGLLTLLLLAWRDRDALPSGSVLGRRVSPR